MLFSKTSLIYHIGYFLKKSSFLLDFTLSNATLVHVLNELLSFHPVNKWTDVPTVPKKSSACQVQHASCRGKGGLWLNIDTKLLFWFNSSSAQGLLPCVRKCRAHTVLVKPETISLHWPLGGLHVINGSWQAHNGLLSVNETHHPCAWKG